MILKYKTFIFRNKIYSWRLDSHLMRTRPGSHFISLDLKSEVRPRHYPLGKPLILYYLMGKSTVLQAGNPQPFLSIMYLYRIGVEIINSKKPYVVLHKHLPNA